MLLFLFSFSTFAKVDCAKHPIFCQIKRNSPKMPNKKAMELSNIIYKASRKHKIPANIYTAILRQESNYHLGAKGCHKGMRKLSHIEMKYEVRACREDAVANPELDYTRCVEGLKNRLVESKVCSDWSMSQVYYQTAKRYDLDLIRLTTDLEYSINGGAKILAGFKAYAKNDDYWWLRYNCGVRGTTKRDTCQIYKKLVERYL